MTGALTYQQQSILMMASFDVAGKDALACTSSQRDDQPKSQNTSLKRKTTKPKTRKVKKARVNSVNYTVHEGEDMLLVIPHSTSGYDGSDWVPKKKKRGTKKVTTKGTGKRSTSVKKRKPTIRTSAVKQKEQELLTPSFVSTEPNDHRWGQNLPEEILVNIFKMVVLQDGAVPFLCRMARVCRLWNAAAATPSLWRRVSVGHCLIAPAKSQLPATQNRIKDTINWLAQNRFSQLRDFSLHHWKTNVDYAVDVVSQFCPQLNTLKLSYCTGLTEATFQSLGQHSHLLRNLNVLYTEAEGLPNYLDSHGAQMQQLWFTHGQKTHRILTAILKSCPNLELLEINTMLDRKIGEVRICVQALQKACPKLKTFRMLNVSPMHKNMQVWDSPGSQTGFPLLEELCIATASHSYMNDKHLQDILFDSPHLRVLDLRGCSAVTSACLVALPCLDLECLFWGQHFNSDMVTFRQNRGIDSVTQKWKHTLRQLDLANQLFSEAELEVAMGHLAQANSADTLRSLNLSGTRITPAALRPLIGQTTALDYLNLSSCRYLPRGLKRIYRGQEDIRQLLDKLE
ncbi:F-box/LRR-repeat protein 6 isoform X1 [Corythoichthys intestinalis]|uniref:F-box/LRR-repeat protein 6 isoform X1 n=1 Tax=Corythoichthys intestinalis TaxID=161448 RepID=UPI0025A64B3B|nr:F-box/LRR-repeat protein 6 isoform X1 [Corythoichthys intestinalis]